MEQKTPLLTPLLRDRDHDPKSCRTCHFRFRFVIYAFVFSGWMAIYFVRTNLSDSFLSMPQPWAKSERRTGMVLAAFYCGYIFGQIPGSRLCERYGAHVVLLAGVAGSVASSLLTPAAATCGGPPAFRCSEGSVIAVRILMGLFEGVVFPATAALCAAWIPPAERSRAVAIVTSGSYPGTVLSFFATPLLNRLGWRAPVTIDSAQNTFC